MPDDAAAFRVEAIEAMARAIALLTCHSDRLTQAHINGQRPRAEAALDALSVVAEKQGLKLLGREPSHEMTKVMLDTLDSYDHMGGAMHDMFNAAHDAATCLTKTGK